MFSFILPSFYCIYAFHFMSCVHKILKRAFLCTLGFVLYGAWTVSTSCWMIGLLPLFSYVCARVWFQEMNWRKQRKPWTCSSCGLRCVNCSYFVPDRPWLARDVLCNWPWPSNWSWNVYNWGPYRLIQCLDNFKGDVRAFFKFLRYSYEAAKTVCQIINVLMWPRLIAKDVQWKLFF